jgi:dienelactone hydrolase
MRSTSGSTEPFVTTLRPSVVSGSVRLKAEATRSLLPRFVASALRGKILAAACGVLLVLAADAAASQRVTFRTDDGVTLVGTWYEPATRPGPAVILVHMLSRTRREWDAIGQRLASEGIGALALDLRGHGESGAAPAADPERTDYSAMVLDLRAARRYLTQRSDVQQSRVGIAGASIGANLAALEASSDPHHLQPGAAVAVARLPRPAHRDSGEESEPADAAHRQR